MRPRFSTSGSTFYTARTPAVNLHDSNARTSGVVLMHSRGVAPPLGVWWQGEHCCSLFLSSSLFLTGMGEGEPRVLVHSRARASQDLPLTPGPTFASELSKSLDLRSFRVRSLYTCVCPFPRSCIAWSFFLGSAPVVLLGYLGGLDFRFLRIGALNALELPW